MKVALCIPTCRRPVGLARLLRSIETLRLPYGVDPVLVVVDNDPDGSARIAAEEAATFLGWPLRYRIESRRGVSFVRNTALDLTLDCELIAFIDDDEAAEGDWLAELLHAQRESGAAAVTGPTLPVFCGPGPSWLRTGFDLCRLRPKPGARMREFATCNLLLDRRVIEAEGLRFDEELSLIGGEDTLLAFELDRRGHRIVWAESALTYEFIPESRMNLRWLLRRWYRTGNTEAVLVMRLRRGAVGRAAGIAGGIARLGLGTLDLAVALPICLLGSRGRALRRLYTVARGAGMIAAICGRQHREYAVVHGG